MGKSNPKQQLSDTNTSGPKISLKHESQIKRRGSYASVILEEEPHFAVLNQGAAFKVYFGAC